MFLFPISTEMFSPCECHVSYIECVGKLYLLLKDSSAGDSMLVCRVSLFQHLWNILSHFILTFKSFCLEILQPCKVSLICSESLFFGAFNVLPVSGLCLQEQGSAHLAHCSRCHVFPFPCLDLHLLPHTDVLSINSEKAFSEGLSEFHFVRNFLYLIYSLWLSWLAIKFILGTYHLILLIFGNYIIS